MRPTMMPVDYKDWVFSFQEQKKFQDWMDRIHTGDTGTPRGPRHPQVKVIGDTLDSLVRPAHEYRSDLEERVSREDASPPPVPGFTNTLRTQIARVDRLIEILDTDALDQLREITNPIATLELRASGRFV